MTDYQDSYARNKLSRRGPEVGFAGCPTLESVMGKSPSATAGIALPGSAITGSGRCR
jgi:hypothetical protein